MMEFHTVEGSRHETLQPYVRGTVSSRISHFMCKGGSIGFLSKINAEIRIQLETTIHCINVHLKQHATFPAKKSAREKNAVNHLHICQLGERSKRPFWNDGR